MNNSIVRNFQQKHAIERMPSQLEILQKQWCKSIAISKITKFKNPIIAVTGSCGKTTTTLFTHSILKTIYKINESHKDRNGYHGILKNINTKFELDSDFWLQEVGIGNPGFMGMYMKYLRPSIRIITNVYTAHVTAFKSVEHYQSEKLIFMNSAPNGTTIIINNDDTLIYNEKKNMLQKKKLINFICCGTKSTDDVQLVSYTLNSDNVTSSFHIRINMNVNKDIFFKMNCIGKHYGMDACLAIACGVYTKVPISSIKNALDNHTLLEHRGKITTVRNLVIYDYTYNAVQAAWLVNNDAFKDIKSENKIIIIDGDNYHHFEPKKSSNYHTKLTKAFSTTKHVIIYVNDKLLLNTEGISKFPLVKIMTFKQELLRYIKLLTEDLSKTWYIFFQTHNMVHESELIKQL